LKQNEGDQEEFSSDEEFLLIGEEYQGEWEIISQTQVVEYPQVGLMSEVLNKVLETQFLVLMESNLELVDQVKKN